MNRRIHANVETYHVRSHETQQKLDAGVSISAFWEKSCGRVRKASAAVYFRRFAEGALDPSANFAPTLEHDARPGLQQPTLFLQGGSQIITVVRQAFANNGVQ